MRLNPRENIILWLAVAAVLAALSANLFVFPLLGKFAIMQDHIRSEELKLREYGKFISAEKELNGLADKFHLSGMERDSAAGDPSSRLKELDRLSSQAGLRIIEVRPAEEKEKNNFSVELKQEGNIFQISRFLYDVECSSLRFTIVKLWLEARSSDNLSLRLVVSLSR